MWQRWTRARNGYLMQGALFTCVLSKLGLKTLNKLMEVMSYWAIINIARFLVLVLSGSRAMMALKEFLKMSGIYLS